MEGGDAFATIARTHRRFGTTSLLATTMTAPREEIADILSQLGAYCRRSLEGGSRILGVHLEGPYINSGKLGAQPNFAHAAVLEEVEDYLRRAPIRVITIAPEIAGHRPPIRASPSAAYACRSAIPWAATRTAWPHWKPAPAASPTSTTR